MYTVTVLIVIVTVYVLMYKYSPSSVLTARAYKKTLQNSTILMNIHSVARADFVMPGAPDHSVKHSPTLAINIAFLKMYSYGSLHIYVTGFWKITLMGALLIQRKTYFNNLKLCYSPALAATRLDFSAKMEQFTTFKSS